MTYYFLGDYLFNTEPSEEHHFSSLFLKDMSLKNDKNILIKSQR